MNELGPAGPPKSNVVQLLEHKPSRRVSVIRDHLVEYPDLWLEVFIQGPAFENRAFAEMLARSNCRKAKSIETADLVIFTGGADVDPRLYGEELHESTSFSETRDSMDLEAYAKCYELGIPMLGICRGAQFLHVMNGGKLYQDIDGHHGDHSMWDVQKQIRLDRVSSVHHQACVLPENHKSLGFRLIATANKSTYREMGPRHRSTGNRIDVEAFFWPDTCCIGIQGHPEYSGYPYFTKWTLDLLNELVLINTDVVWDKIDGIGRRRLRPEVIEARKLMGLAPKITVRN